MTFRVLVTGSRTWTDTHAIYTALNAVYADHPGLTVVHGAAREGADAIAAAWHARVWAEEERHPARWAEIGKAAGIVRNQEMVRAGADLCLAFIAPCSAPRCGRPGPHGSHGATDCAHRAEAAGIPTRRFTAQVMT